jgi:23S rRNA (guanine745-N1)-methyltransferase
MSSPWHDQPKRAALGAILPRLRCPICAQGFEAGPSAVTCPAGHCFDVAREAYLNLLPGHRAPGQADNGPMVERRRAFLEAGHYRPLEACLLDQVLGWLPRGPHPALMLDLGAGPGHYLTGLLEALPGTLGLALDISREAARRASRAHPRLAAVVADCNRPLPLASHAAGLALSVFAPRPAPELRRVLAPDGLLLVAMPGPGHLQELREAVGMIGQDPDKEARLAQRLEGLFQPLGEQHLTFPLTLDRQALLQVVGMGPSAFHLSEEELTTRVSALPQPFGLTAAFQVSVWRPAPEVQP